MRLSNTVFFFVKKNIGVISGLILMFFVQNSFSQPQINSHIAAFDLAKDLYDDGLLLSARKGFENYLVDYPASGRLEEAKYFVALCAVKLSQEDGEGLMKGFVNSHPHHVYVSGAYLELARHFYQNQKYENAKRYYQLAQESQSTFKEEDLFGFGYSFFASKEYEEAQNIFLKLENSQNEVGKNAFYFLGFISYKNESLTDSKTYLERAFDSKRYGEASIKLYISILYASGDYQKLIELVNEKLDGKIDAEILKMQADAYFEIENYRMAAITYSNLFREYPRYRTHQSYYRAGVSYLKVEDVEKSIDNLKRAALSKDTLGAYASYQLGILYVNTDNLVFAAASFSNVAKFDTELTREAAFLQAKMEFDLENYDTAISLLLNYQKEYGRNEHSSFANEMLSESYLNTNNYDRAIKYIEGLSTLTPKTKSAYQRVTFLKGIGLYNASRYYEGIEFFKKSLTYTTNPILEAEAYYYVGEAYTRGGKYQDSKFYYEQAIESKVSQVYLQSIYGLAYAYFNLLAYEEAFDTFLQFDQQRMLDEDNKYSQDVLVRMGDCSYVLKNYETAIEYYNRALEAKNKNQAYIHFQKGLVYRYSDQVERSIGSFKVVLNEYASSDRSDDALFQITQINFENGNYEATIKHAKKLISEYPDSRFLPYALLNEAVAQNNLGNQKAAIRNYTNILDRFPRHTTSNSALLGLQELAGSGQFDNFEAYLEKYKKANPNSEALENIEFETAKALFFNQNYDKAIEAFTAFKNQYPESTLLIESTYFIADSWYRKDEGKKALEYYYDISDHHDYSKYRRIQYRIATLEANQGNHEISNQYFLRLRKSNGTFKDLNNAHFGLLSNHFRLSAYDSAVYYGETLMNSSRIPIEMSNNAYLLLGKAEYNRENLDEASDWFLLLINDSPDVRGAEAKYYLSKILYEKGEYNNSLQSLFELKEEYRLFGYWVGEAFLLMADNYMATDETFQAKATLNSLIENVSIEDIRAKAMNKLELIESQEKIQGTDSTYVNNEDK